MPWKIYRQSIILKMGLYRLFDTPVGDDVVKSFRKGYKTTNDTGFNMDDYLTKIFNTRFTVTKN